jgi:hypothetical protein
VASQSEVRIVHLIKKFEFNWGRMDVVVERELSPAMPSASDWTCKSAPPFGIGLILVRVLVEQTQTFDNFAAGIIKVNADASAPSLS